MDKRTFTQPSPLNSNSKPPFPFIGKLLGSTHFPFVSRGSHSRLVDSQCKTRRSLNIIKIMFQLLSRNIIIIITIIKIPLTDLSSVSPSTTIQPDYYKKRGRGGTLKRTGKKRANRFLKLKVILLKRYISHINDCTELRKSNTHIARTHTHSHTRKHTHSSPSVFCNWVK